MSPVILVVDLFSEHQATAKRGRERKVNKKQAYDNGRCLSRSSANPVGDETTVGGRETGLSLRINSVSAFVMWGPCTASNRAPNLPLLT
ncbi:hypothetical protein MTP99_016915 [Tenebrio molitor]|nr:hypothetical protein MTP99_016915 [Tenebrio molitor]